MIKQVVSAFILAVLSFAFLVECKSVPDRVKELSDNSYFQEASTVIATEQKKLSENPDLSKLKELERARQLFDQSVSTHFGIETEKLNSQGKVREALKVSQEAHQLCPWSDTIKSMVTRYKDIV